MDQGIVMILFNEAPIHKGKCPNQIRSSAAARVAFSPTQISFVSLITKVVE